MVFIDLLIVCFGSICLGVWGSAEAQDNDLVPLTHTGWFCITVGSDVDENLLVE